MSKVTNRISIPFVKATACGNDFLIIDSALVAGDRAEFTRRICDRHFGVGADGVEWLLPGGNDADVQIHLINADGSPAEISGNGTRCVAACWFLEQNRAASGQGRVRIHTDAGIKICTLHGYDGSEFEFETAMGSGIVASALKLKLTGGEVEGTPVSTGNPHFVLFVRDFEPDWQRAAREIGAHSHFESGTNVELVKVIDESNIEIRIFERGAGETQSSGTGSCAAAVATISCGRAKSPLQVRAPGGAQTVRWESGEIFLRGPARLVCRGEYLWQP